MISKPAAARADRDAAVHWITLERSRTVAAILVDPQGSILRCNDRFREAVGPDVLTRSANIARWLDGEPWDAALERARQRRTIRLTIGRESAPPLSLHGELIETTIETGKPCLVGIFPLSPEIDTAEAVLARNARLEALVCLTSGVAHDFNNLLTVLSGNLSLAAEEVRAYPKTFGKLKAARDAANRGGELIRQLLAFAKQQEIGSELIDPARIARSIAPLVERALGNKIRLDLDLDEQAGQIHASAVQLESAIVNLAVNARDALEKGGAVTIGVRSAGANAASGGSVVISVADNGPGIPPDIIGKVREPFFTTKSGRGGTGLGLSMVDTFARRHGGRLDIRSAAGRGTRVSLIFPRAADRLDESIAATMPLLALPSGTETIVAVARDPSILSTVEQILTVLGYSVHCATGLQDATALIRAREPALIVTDGFDVRALLGVCRPIEGRPICRGLELVGQQVDRESPEDSGDARLLRLAKPFSLPDFARGVRKLLDRPV